MTTLHDGPASSLFTPLSFQGSTPLKGLANKGVSPEMAGAVQHAPQGECVGWGIPFTVGDVLVIRDQPFSLEITPTRASWFVFMHTSDIRPLPVNPQGFTSPMRGQGQLAEHAADYVLVYSDGTEARAAIHRRHQVGAFDRGWGENCFEAVAQHKPHPVHAMHEQLKGEWGWTQTRNTATDGGPWVNWLWAWENPYPEKTVSGLRFEPGSGLLIVSAISAGNVSAQPLRWQPRQKACFSLPARETFLPELDDDGLLAQIQLDLGQVISALPRLVYPNDAWAETYNNQMPEMAKNEVLVEYSAHPEACFHLAGVQGAQVIPAAAS